jgi:hypothetical protein
MPSIIETALENLARAFLEQQAEIDRLKNLPIISNSEDARLVSFNINSRMKARLNAEGHARHRENFDALEQSVPSMKLKYRPVKEDAGGWSEWQMWEFMREFGAHIHMGEPPPFETEIMLEIEP